MAFQSVPNTAEAVVRYTQNGQICTLTFYGLYALGYGQTEIDDLADLMDGWAAAEFLPVLSNQSNYTSVEVRGLDVLNDRYASNSDGASAGGYASAPYPNSVAFAVKRITGFTGRSARGRVYMPVPVGYTAANEDFISEAAGDSFVDALNEVRVAMAAGGWVEVVVSRYSGGSLRPTGTSNPVTGYEYTDLELDSQRRRMPGR